MELSQKKCKTCAQAITPLQGAALQTLYKQLPPGWKIVDEHHLEREFTFKNFHEALAFVNRIGAIAEEEGHHPDIFLAWGKVKITLYTHKIGGLSEGDFILAAKCEL